MSVEPIQMLYQRMLQGTVFRRTLREAGEPAPVKGYRVLNCCLQHTIASSKSEDCICRQRWQISTPMCNQARSKIIHLP